MSKCRKVKNPCAICLNSVTQKNGLRCQGACQSWVHYSCLNYTPGKIKDVKAGIIRVNCPCPDCKSVLPREYRADEPYSCNNNQCPANNPPKCGNILCPINNGTPEEMQQKSVPCPLGQCGTGSCKQNSTPQIPSKVSPPVGSPCVTHSPTQATSDECLKPNKCPSGCESEPGDFGNKNREGFSLKVQPQNNITSTVAQMCNTVGVLSEQINDLMNQMKQAAQERGGGCGSGKQKKRKRKENKTLCPAPCLCPGNPKRRK